jgi:dimethylglycine dehydrogenase
MKSHSRVVIVGGGMMGVGLLYHLALEGWDDCILHERALQGPMAIPWANN